MTGAVTGSSATGLTTFLTAAGLGAGLTTFRGGGALRTTFGGCFGVGVASSGVGRISGGIEPYVGPADGSAQLGCAEIGTHEG